MQPLTRTLLIIAALAAMPAALAGQTLEDYDYENLEFRGIGLEFGGVWPATVEQTFNVGLRADLGYIGPNIRIIPAMRIWSSSLKDGEVDRFAEQVIAICQRQGNTVCPSRLDLGEIDVSDIELSVEGHYLFPTDFIPQPYLGAGGGLHLLNGQGEAIDGTFVEDLLDTLVPGLNVLAGVTLPLVPTFEIFAEARYVLVSDVRHANLSVGGVWQLPSPVRSPFRD